MCAGFAGFTDGHAAGRDAALQPDGANRAVQGCAARLPCPSQGLLPHQALSISRQDQTCLMAPGVRVRLTCSLIDPDSGCHMALLAMAAIPSQSSLHEVKWVLYMVAV